MTSRRLAEILVGLTVALSIAAMAASVAGDGFSSDTGNGQLLWSLDFPVLGLAIIRRTAATRSPVR